MLHENTRIYPKAIALAEMVAACVDGFPAGYAFLGDQMRRAAASVVLNFAEGCGKRTPRDRAKFFVDARGSAAEVAAAFDVARVFSLVDAARCARAKQLCDELGAMIYLFR